MMTKFISTRIRVFLCVIVLTFVLFGLGWFLTDTFFQLHGEEKVYTQLASVSYVDMTQVLANYEQKHEAFLQELEPSLQQVDPRRPPITVWLPAVGVNGYEGYVSEVDLRWTPFGDNLYGASEFVKVYDGYFMIPVFAPDFSAIIDYFIVE